MTGTQIGEGFAGDGAHVAHVNTVLGHRGGPVETAWVTALATPRAGHIPFVAVVRPGLPVRPFTLFVNKAPLAGETHSRLTWGPAQAGVAAGVTDALRGGVLDTTTAAGQLLVAAVWVDPAASDDTAVFENNRAATFDALRAGAAGEPSMGAVLDEGDRPWNPYFTAFKPGG